jgi:hypothetical protein
MLSGVDEFFNRFVKITIVLSDVLCLLALSLELGLRKALISLKLALPF